MKRSEDVILTHSEGIGGGAHFLHIPLHGTELLIKRTATVPEHRRLQDIATATICFKQGCVQLHGQVWEEQKGTANNVK